MAASRGQQPINLRLRTPAGTARILRRHFRRHNWQVVALALGILLTALLSWVLLYCVLCWLFVLAMAVFALPFTRVPHGFLTLYIVAAICALAYAWIDQLLTPNAAPRDEKSVFEVISDFALAIPRLTLAAAGTLAAWQRLDDADLLDAAALLHWVAEKKRVPMSGVRLQIPDATSAARILFALQLTQVIDVHRDEQEFWLRLNALRPAELRLGPETRPEPSAGPYADA